MKFLVFDTETTGLPRINFIGPGYLEQWPHIVQFSYVIYDDISNTLEINDNIIQLPDNIDKASFKNFEWFFYNNSLKALFKKISEQTPKSDNKWIKTSTESQLKLVKAFKELNEVYQKCR